MMDVFMQVGAALLALVGVYLVGFRGRWPDGWPVKGEPVILGLLGFLVYLVCVYLGGHIGRIFEDEPARGHLGSGLVRFLCALILYFIVKTLVHQKDPMHVMRPKSWAEVGRVVLPYLCILPVMYLVTPEANQKTVIDLRSFQGFLPRAYLFFEVVVAAPFFEEFLFRGFLQGAMRRGFPAGVSIVVIAFLFAFVHDQSVWPPVFCLGLLLGVIYEKYRAFWAPWVIHTLHNLITYILIVSGVAHA